MPTGFSGDDCRCLGCGSCAASCREKDLVSLLRRAEEVLRAPKASGARCEVVRLDIERMLSQLDGNEEPDSEEAEDVQPALHWTEDLVQGIHECPQSPSKICYYDEEKDPAWDRCIYCGEPHERK